MKIKKINRMVVKIGSSLLIDKDKGVNNNFLNNISEDIVSLKKRDIETLIVSSGAIELGKIELNKTKEKLNLSESQAASSIGQIKLINAWKDSLGKFDLNAAQILITAEDTENRKRFLNARSTIEELMREKYIPIINENDTVATSEIMISDVATVSFSFIIGIYFSRINSSIVDLAFKNLFLFSVSSAVINI